MKKEQPFLTYEQQLAKLKKDKLVIDDENFAIKTLQNISYYSLICGYKDIFKDKETNKYRTESKFEDIYMLYQFDESLRNIIFKYILKIERKIKSYYSYTFCEKFGEKQSEYLNVNNYNYSQFQNKVNGLITILKEAMEENRPNLKHHKNNHGNVPLWVLVNVLTLGNISIAYQCSQQDIQAKIAQQFDNVFSNQLRSMLTVLTKFRNACAHNERLYLYTTQDSILDLKIHKSFSNKNTGKNDLLAISICFKYLLEQEAFVNFLNEFNQAITMFLSEMDIKIRNDIFSKMGLANVDLNILINK